MAHLPLDVQADLRDRLIKDEFRKVLREINRKVTYNEPRTFFINTIMVKPHFLNEFRIWLGDYDRSSRNAWEARQVEEVPTNGAGGETQNRLIDLFMSIDPNCPQPDYVPTAESCMICLPLPEGQPTYGLCAKCFTDLQRL